jgi:hypothetical protein
MISVTLILVVTYGSEPYMNAYKMFWEELIDYFPLIRHFQQFIVAAGTLFPSRCLATIEGYTDRLTDSPLI